LTYKTSGRGVSGGPVGSMLIFTVAIELDGKVPPNPVKEDLTVFVSSPGDPLKPTVMGGTGGSYHIGLKPTEAGQHYVDFCWRGTWASEAYMLPVKDKSGNVPDHTYTPPPAKTGGSAPSTSTPTTSTPTTRTTPSTTTSPAKTTTTTAAPKVPSAAKCTLEGLSTSITDLEESQFTIHSRDARDGKLPGGHQFDVTITNTYDDQKAPTPVVEDNSDGSYLVKYGPLDAGTYSIAVTYKNDHVAGSPASVQVEEGVVGGALSELDILFVLRDKEGNAIKMKGGSEYLKAFSSKSSNLSITEPDEGSYSILLDTPGDSVVDVQLSGKSIEGFPLEVKLD